MKSFSIKLIVSALVVAVAILAMNYKVDAYGVFKNGIQHDKYDTSGFLRNIKPFWLKKKDYNGIVIGTSRAHNGIDPDSINQYFEDIHFFNYGQSALSYSGARHILHYAKSEEIQNYIILLDTYLLPNNRRNLGDHLPDWIPDYGIGGDKNEYFSREVYKKLFSINAFNKNLRKITKLEGDKIWKDNGLNTLGYDQFEGGRKLAGPMRANLRKGKHRSFTDSKFEVFKESMDALCTCKGEALLMYPPVSMYYLSAIEYQSPGVTHEFKTKTLAYINQLIKSGKCDTKFLVYDFMYPNDVTNEDLRIRKPSQYYRDPSHFRASTGTAAIRAMKAPEQNPYDNFGIDLLAAPDNTLDSLNTVFEEWHKTIGIPTIKEYNLLQFIR